MLFLKVRSKSLEVNNKVYGRPLGSKVYCMCGLGMDKMRHLMLDRERQRMTEVEKRQKKNGL